MNTAANGEDIPGVAAVRGQRNRSCRGICHLQKKAPI